MEHLPAEHETFNFLDQIATGSFASGYFNPSEDATFSESINEPD
jgi:hypothetical protein